jgi:hypothetical protein
MDYNLGGDFTSIKASTIVSMKEHVTVLAEKGPIDLEIKISADLAEIPQEYHEVFLNVLSAKYYGKVSFGDNPFSQCKPYNKRKWYEFWKAKWFKV